MVQRDGSSDRQTEERKGKLVGINFVIGDETNLRQTLKFDFEYNKYI